MMTRSRGARRRRRPCSPRARRVHVSRPPSTWHTRRPRGRYVVSLHWSMMTVTSIGYGDISPASLIEYGISILCQFIGAVTWAACVSQLAGIFANLNPHETAWKQASPLVNPPLLSKYHDHHRRHHCHHDDHRRHHRRIGHGRD